MKIIVSTLTAVALLSSAGTLTADHHKVKLIEQLQPLAFLVGEWTTDTNASVNFRIGAEGGTLVGEHSWGEGDQRVSITEIFYWDATGETIALFGTTKSGAVWRAAISQVGDKLVGQSTGVYPGRKPVSSVNHREIVDSDTHTYQSTHRFYAGAPVPDDPKVTLKRVK